MKAGSGCDRLQRMTSRPGSFHLCSSLDPAECVFIVDSPRTVETVTALEKVLSIAVHRIPGRPEALSDVWIQDALEFGQIRTKDGWQSGVMLGLRAAHDQGINCQPMEAFLPGWLSGLMSSVQQIRVGEPLPKRRWIDWYGNLEVTPPLLGHPHGRIMYGQQKELGFHPQALKFLEDQAVQWPPIIVDVSWLLIGHVDEAVAFVPADKGFKVLLPSPDAWLEATKSLSDNHKAFEERTNSPTIGELRAAAGNKENRLVQSAVEKIAAQMVKECSLKSEDIISLPGLFEFGGAMTPSLVNGLMAEGKFIMTDPCSPAVRAYTAEKFKQTKAKPVFIPAWDGYHVRGGEVHCGTNALRKILRP